MRLTEARQPALGPWPKGGSVAAQSSHTPGFGCLFWDVGTGCPHGCPRLYADQATASPSDCGCFPPPPPAPGPRHSLDPFTDHSYVLACAHWCRALSIHPRESQCQARSS